MTELAEALCLPKSYGELLEKELNNNIWPHRELWGEHRQAVMDYMRTEYEKDTPVSLRTFPRSNTPRIVLEARDIFQYWWRRSNRAGSHNFDDSPEDFGQWLLTQYLEARRLTIADNRGQGRFR